VTSENQCTPGRQSTTTLKLSVSPALLIRAVQEFVEPGEGKLSTTQLVPLTFAGPPDNRMSPALQASVMMEVPSPWSVPASIADSFL
jgi:hypothetical protein